MAELRVKGTGTLKLFESDNTSSVTIASPASLSANKTITLPDADVTLASGTMLATDGSGASLTSLNASELGSGTVPTARLGTGTASSSTFLAGDNTWGAAGGGKLLQVTQRTVTGTTTHSTISTFTASTIYGTITPSATSSKILVHAFLKVRIALNPATLLGGGVQIYKDVGGGGYSALWPSSASSSDYSMGAIGGDSVERWQQTYMSIHYLDSPSTTSEITYKLYGAAGPSSYGNIITGGPGASVILMEIDGS